MSTFYSSTLKTQKALRKIAALINELIKNNIDLAKVNSYIDYLASTFTYYSNEFNELTKKINTLATAGKPTKESMTYILYINIVSNHFQVLSKKYIAAKYRYEIDKDLDALNRELKTIRGSIRSLYLFLR